MKVLLSVLVLICACAFTGCKTARNKSGELQISSSGLKLEQQFYLEKYCVFRGKITRFLGLKVDAPTEKIRSSAAVFLKYPEKTSWEKLLSDSRIQDVFTEKKRLKYIEAFELSRQTTWIELKNFLEKLRLRQMRY